MVDAKKLKGWVIDEDGLNLIRNSDNDGGEVFIEYGVRKATVWICGYCEEEYWDTEKEAEDCCKKPSNGVKG